MLRYVDQAHDSTPADPMALRALAHPLRWKLIDVIGTEGSATATRCAEAVGESVASCSYHLGILAKYGYIELVPDQPGREKPWRLISWRQDLLPDGLDTEGALVAEAAMEAFLDHEFARTKHRLRRRSVEPEEWRDASRIAGMTTWMTSDELHEVSDQLMEIMTSFEERLTDPAARPEGARQVRLFVVTSVAPPATSAMPSA
jgi:hypothetical protein